MWVGGWIIYAHGGTNDAEQEAKQFCVKMFTISSGTDWVAVEKCIKEQLAARKRVEERK